MNTESTRGKQAKRRVGYLVLVAVSSLAMDGCRRGPTFNILGSYFPGWIACVVVGISLAVALHFLLVRYGWEARVPASPLFYLCLTILLSCLFWLIFFE